MLELRYHQVTKLKKKTKWENLKTNLLTHKKKYSNYLSYLYFNHITTKRKQKKKKKKKNKPKRRKAKKKDFLYTLHLLNDSLFNPQTFHFKVE